MCAHDSDEMTHLKQIVGKKQDKRVPSEYMKLHGVLSLFLFSQRQACDVCLIEMKDVFVTCRKLAQLVWSGQISRSKMQRLSYRKGGWVVGRQKECGAGHIPTSSVPDCSRSGVPLRESS